MAEYFILPNELEENKLFEQYNMTTAQVKNDVSVIRRWMLTQPNLPEFPESKNGNHPYIWQYYYL